MRHPRIRVAVGDEEIAGRTEVQRRGTVNIHRGDFTEIPSLLAMLSIPVVGGLGMYMAENTGDFGRRDFDLAV